MCRPEGLRRVATWWMRRGGFVSTVFRCDRFESCTQHLPPLAATPLRGWTTCATGSPDRRATRVGTDTGLGLSCGGRLCASAARAQRASGRETPREAEFCSALQRRSVPLTNGSAKGAGSPENGFAGGVRSAGAGSPGVGNPQHPRGKSRGIRIPGAARARGRQGRKC